jgi:hypothetical protein
MEEFFHSKAMMTPGAVGATTTMITGTLASQFGLPGNWTGLVLSLLFGLSVWADKSVPVYQRIIFYIINSMTIFAVAIGINTAGMVINKSTERKVAPHVIEEKHTPAEQQKFFQDWFR